MPTGKWGFFKVPGCWPGITDYMQKDCQTVFANPSWKEQTFGKLTAAWYQREITIPTDWTGRRIALYAEYVNSYVAVHADGKRNTLTVTGMVLSSGDPLIIKCMGGLVQTVPQARIDVLAPAWVAPVVRRMGLRANAFERWMLRGRRTKHWMRAVYALRSLGQLKRASLSAVGEEYWQAGKSVGEIDAVLPVAEVMAGFAAAYREVEEGSSRPC